jgi:hypothetical protein
MAVSFRCAARSGGSRLVKKMYGWGCVAALSAGLDSTPSPPIWIRDCFGALLLLLHCCCCCHVYMMRHCIASGIGHESGAWVQKPDKLGHEKAPWGSPMRLACLESVLRWLNASPPPYCNPLALAHTRHLGARTHQHACPNRQHREHRPEQVSVVSVPAHTASTNTTTHCPTG